MIACVMQDDKLFSGSIRENICGFTHDVDEDWMQGCTRAIYKKPGLLFMDEATSALDKESEDIVNQAIKGLSITRVIIAHRETTIASVDRVIYLY